MMMIANMVMAIPWTFIFLFTRWFGLRLYHLRNREQCRRIQKQIGEFCTHMIDGKGAGFSMGWWYMIHIQLYGDTYDVWLVATKTAYERLTSIPPSELALSSSSTLSAEKKEEMITIYERMGSYKEPFFRQRKIHSERLVPRKEQMHLMEEIIEYFKEHHRAVIYLYGPTGTGKSIMGLLLAKALNGMYCSTLKPWQPGDSIGELYTEMEPTAENPLILVFDEVDVALHRIHMTISSNQDVPIMVADKNDWNRMMDEIHWGLYPHMILLMTSNSVPQSIHDLDPSYLRKGRVDLCFTLEN